MKRIVKLYVTFLIISFMLCLTTAASSAPDTISPTAPKGLTAAEVTHTTISLRWTSSHDNIGVKGYQVYRDGKRITSITKTEYTNKNLVPGTKYSYTIKAYDTAGNLSENSIALDVVTLKDTIEPSPPEALTCSPAAFTSVSLTWKPAADNVGVKGYEIYCNDRKVASTSAVYYEYKKLAPGTDYTFYIRACDKAGNYSAPSNSISVSTLPDKKAPSPPIELKASSVSVTEVNLTWSPASDNVKVRGYDILRDGIKIGTTTKTSYASKKLIPGKSYNYIIRATDVSGNLSGNSNSINVATPDDTQAPTAPSKLKITTVKGTSVSLEWTGSTDNSKVAGYQIYCRGIVIATAAGTKRTVRSPFGLDSEDFWVKAYDLGGNLSDRSNIVTAVAAP